MQECRVVGCEAAIVGIVGKQAASTSSRHVLVPGGTCRRRTSICTCTCRYSLAPHPGGGGQREIPHISRLAFRESRDQSNKRTWPIVIPQPTPCVLRACSFMA